MEKLKKRAERFGSSVSPAITAVSSATVVTYRNVNYYYEQIEEDEKKKKRSERFGLTAAELCIEVHVMTWTVGECNAISTK